MNNAPTFLVTTTRSGQLTSLADLAAIFEEEMWLTSQKSARTRRLYKQNVAHFTHLGITTRGASLDGVSSAAC